MRYQDRRNFYYVRINPQESNLRLYLMEDGERREIGEDYHLDLDEKEWHVAQLDVIGNRLAVIIDDQRMLEVVDEAISSPGRAGLWTTPGAETAFAALSITRLH